MGWIEHDSVIIECPLRDAEAVRAKLVEWLDDWGLGRLVGPAIGGGVNGSAQILIAGSGSKRGWGDKHSWDLAMRGLLAWIAEQQDADADPWWGVNFVRLEWGGDGDTVEVQDASFGEWAESRGGEE